MRVTNRMPKEELVKDRTVIMIAHKWKNVAGAGQILVLDQGGIVE